MRERPNHYTLHSTLSIEPIFLSCIKLIYVEQKQTKTQIIDYLSPEPTHTHRSTSVSLANVAKRVKTRSQSQKARGRRQPTPDLNIDR